MRRPTTVVLPHWRNLAAFGAAVVSIGLGLTCLAIWVARPHFGDGQVLLDAGSRLAAGEPIYQGEMLYPPLAAVLGAVLRLVPNWFLMEAGLRVAVMVVGAWIATRGHSRAVRVLAVVVVITCIPFVEDLVEANEMTWLALSVAVVVWRREDPRAGIPLGIVCALFAKPQLLPFLLWMLLWRRRALFGTLVSGAAAGVFGAIVAGPHAYLDWIRYALSQIGGTSSPFPGNQSLAVILGSWMPVAMALLLIGLVLALWRLDEWAALVWALATGILILPYASGLSLVPLLVAWRQLGRVGPLGGLLASPLALFAPATMLLGVLATQVRGVGTSKPKLSATPKPHRGAAPLPRQYLARERVHEAGGSGLRA